MRPHKLNLPLMALTLALSLATGCRTFEELVDTPVPTPTRTSIPTSTPTATFTATATLTPTATPTAAPTNTPTSTPSPQSVLTDMVITLEDLPPGFEAIPSDELGFTKEDLSNDDFVVESLFTFLEAEHFEFVMGFTTPVQNRLDQIGFDTALNRPEFLMESLVEGMGAIGILEQSELPTSDDIGDASAGLSVLADIEGIPMRMDMVVFRREIVGAFVYVMYLEGDEPVVTVNEVASRFDDRIIEVLPSGE